MNVLFLLPLYYRCNKDRWGVVWKHFHQHIPNMTVPILHDIYISYLHTHAQDHKKPLYHRSRPYSFWFIVPLKNLSTPIFFVFCIAYVGFVPPKRCTPTHFYTWFLPTNRMPYLNCCVNQSCPKNTGPIPTWRWKKKPSGMKPYNRDFFRRVFAEVSLFIHQQNYEEARILMAQGILEIRYLNDLLAHTTRLQ